VSNAPDRDTREILHSAFAFVRSVEANRASAAITIDHVIQQQVKFLKAGEIRPIVDASGSSTGSRTSRYDEIKQLQDQVNKLVTVAREYFGSVTS
jgi:hypothetical protein